MTPIHLSILWLIPVLPLAGAAINGFFGRRFSRKADRGSGSHLLRRGFCIGTLSSPPAFPPFPLLIISNLAHWIRSGNFQVDFSFYLDQLSLVMLLVVTGVGFLIHIYSVGYMWDDDSYYRFLSYLNLFMFFMLTLVLAQQLPDDVHRVGGRGPRVVSADRLLVHQRFCRCCGQESIHRQPHRRLRIPHRAVPADSSVSDRSISQRVSQRSNRSPGNGGRWLPDGYRLAADGGRRRQIGADSSICLAARRDGRPDAVSALIHAATMVTAGVYMVARSHVIFERAPSALTVVAIIGTLTALFAATIGIAQTDIKKVLAYSTVSQLGYMFMACGVAAFSAGIFHLMTHAFFKGLLFLAAGSVIHACRAASRTCARWAACAGTCRSPF